MNTDQTPFCVLCLQFQQGSLTQESVSDHLLADFSFLLRTFWEITWLRSYLEDSGSLHNHMERAICRHVLPLSLLVSRGTPALFSTRRDPEGWSQHLLAWAPLMLGKGKPADEVPQKCLCLQEEVLLSQCLMHQGKKKGWKKRIQPYNAQHTTFHFEIQTRWKQGKQVPYWICNLSAFLSWFVMSH